MRNHNLRAHEHTRTCTHMHLHAHCHTYTSTHSIKKHGRAQPIVPYTYDMALPVDGAVLCTFIDVHAGEHSDGFAVSSSPRSPTIRKKRASIFTRIKNTVMGKKSELFGGNLEYAMSLQSVGLFVVILS